MTTTRVTTAVVAAVLLAGASICPAQIPAKLNYQVMLTDDLDHPLADQAVTMVFTFYDAESGGTALWTETQNPTTNSIGVVSVILGSVTPVGFDFDAPMWLEVEVNGETLSPRRELTAAPYAGHAAASDDSERLGNIDASEYALLTDLVGTGDGHSLDADDGNPVDALYVNSDGDVGIGTTSPQAELHVQNDLQVGSISTMGSLMVHGGATGAGGVRLQGDGYDGGYVSLVGGNGFAFATLGHSSGSGDGGKLWLSKDSLGTNGIWADADYNGTGSGRMDITGASETISFNLTQTGDATVSLPLDAINSYETADEPGVASAVDAGSTSFTGSRQNMDVRSITAPTNGYILAVGTVELALYHTYNTSNNLTSVQVGLSDNSSYIPPSQDTVVQVPDRAGTGTHRHVATVHGVFPAYAGLTKTVWMYAWRTMGTSGYYRNVHISLLFIPTARGTVETISATAAQGGEPATDEFLAITDPGGTPNAVTGSGDSVTIPRELLDNILARIEELEHEAEEHNPTP